MEEIVKFETLIIRPHYVQAWVENDRLIVESSPLVPDNDPVYRPVTEFLATQQTEVVSSEVIEDDTEQWMFGEYRRTVYRLVIR
ncbi:hypothetical protein SAMN05216215_104748 [Saccharopolyspora shandongensis]|uniref:Uncharacterized protein n=1 Tax=Saccharopolyspora shandongensis TaxID=418495 RepID=A0A1H3QFK0_9PSEU|nr:hypothetical protein [Saccharopolyspora shandongensis]SDZ12166.1 hypothetical protein SAMN05216215_104748 [Saccharopolyspora shandongensis]